MTDAEKLAEALAKLEKAEASLRDNDVKKVQASADALQVSLNAKVAEVATLADEVKAAKAALAEVQAKLTEVETAKAAADAELAKVRAEEVKRSRETEVAKTLSLDAAAAELFVKDLGVISDEQFTALLKVVTAVKSTPAPLPPKETPAPIPPKQTPAKARNSGKDAEANADPANLEDAEVDANRAAAGVSVDPADDGVESVRKAIAEHWDSRK